MNFHGNDVKRREGVLVVGAFVGILHIGCTAVEDFALASPGSC